MKLSVLNIERAVAGAFTCDLYVDGVLAAHVRHTGLLGQALYTWVGTYAGLGDIDIPDDIQRHLNTLPLVYPSYRYPPDLDYCIEELVDEQDVPS